MMNKLNVKLLKNISYYGELCFKNYYSSALKEINIKNDELLVNWWSSIKYYFFHTFMRGRSDLLSIRYCKYTIKIIEDNLLNGNYNWDTFKAKIKNIDDRTMLFGKSITINNRWVTLNNYKDVHMVVDSFKFFIKLNDGNVVIYFRNKIINGKLQELYEELTKIREIGDKIASFILRNTVRIHNIKVAEKDLYYLLPIDTWIDKINIISGIYDNNTKKSEKKGIMIKNCSENNIDPILYNQGAWYIGFNSLDHIIDILKKINIQELENST